MTQCYHNFIGLDTLFYHWIHILDNAKVNFQFSELRAKDPRRFSVVNHKSRTKPKTKINLKPTLKICDIVIEEFLGEHLSFELSTTFHNPFMRKIAPISPTKCTSISAWLLASGPPYKLQRVPMVLNFSRRIRTVCKVLISLSSLSY